MCVEIDSVMRIVCEDEEGDNGSGTKDVMEEEQGGGGNRCDNGEATGGIRPDNSYLPLPPLQEPTSSSTLRSLPLNEATQELQSLMKIAGPIVMTTMLIFSRSVISMLFLGHLGELELAGGSLALGFGNITGHSILKGLAVGMEPICGQAYGAKKWSVLSQTYQKTSCLLLLVCIPISILWLNIEPIFNKLGQDPEITKLAQIYMVYSIPELFAQASSHPLRTFLRTQGLTAPSTIACMWSVVLHLPINYFLVIYMGMGVKGVPLALAWSTINLNLGLVAYVILSDKPIKPWHGVTFLSLFQGWRPLLALSLPSCLSVCLEWWWYEIILFLCGLLDDAKAAIATTGILIQTTGLLYTFPFSLSSGLSARVGQALGAERPSHAHLIAIIGIVASIAYGLAAFMFAVAIRSVWGRIYTDEPQILHLVSAVMPIIGLCEVANSMQTSACGVLMGTARPNIGARINLFSFYAVGMPVAVVGTFELELGFPGMWYGLLASQVSCVCLMTYTLIKTDWRHQVKRAKELTSAVGENNNVDDNNDGNDLETGLLRSQQSQLFRAVTSDSNG